MIETMVGFKTLSVTSSFHFWYCSIKRWMWMDFNATYTDLFYQTYYTFYFSDLSSAFQICFCQVWTICHHIQWISLLPCFPSISNHLHLDSLSNLECCLWINTKFIDLTIWIACSYKVGKIILIRSRPIYFISFHFGPVPSPKIEKLA